MRHRHVYGNFNLDPNLSKVFDTINSGIFGDPSEFGSLISSITEYGDYYLVSDDFDSYITTQGLIDEAFANRQEWIVKSILSVARMGFFSTDRVINEYAENIWNVEPLVVKD